jgi:DNA mismatch repair ATPase MutS
LPAAAGWLFASSAAITVVLLSLGFAGRIATGWPAAWLAVQIALALYWRRQVRLVLDRIEGPAQDLGLLMELVARIEGEPLGAGRLAKIGASLVRDGAPPSALIARLRKYVSALDSTENQLFRPVAALLLVKSQAAVAIDRWHAEHRAALVEWLQAVGELEALSSLATHAYEHPADVFPEIVEAGPRLEAFGLAHPLLVEVASVRNDVVLGGSAPQVLIVSGSNMSGKSTLLRAVGVNVVLALAGGVVRAERMVVTRLAIGATLRIEDSLQAGHSRFYAEILRIRHIVEIARGPLPLLFLLDEILHGTNSHDRRIGAQAIVRALVEAGAIGLVTTHDLALTELVPALGGRAGNVHFEDRLEDGKMVFDYRMRSGVVDHSNALALMRGIGLDV